MVGNHVRSGEAQTHIMASYGQQCEVTAGDGVNPE